MADPHNQFRKLQPTHGSGEREGKGLVAALVSWSAQVVGVHT
jgi:hypothetical protein